jgi:hypothetical protein
MLVLLEHALGEAGYRPQEFYQKEKVRMPTIAPNSGSSGLRRFGLLPSAENQERHLLHSVYYLEACTAAQSSEDLLKASLRFKDLMKHLASPLQRAGAGISPIDPFAAAPIVWAMVQRALGLADEALKLSDEALRRARHLKTGSGRP